MSILKTDNFNNGGTTEDVDVYDANWVSVLNVTKNRVVSNHFLDDATSTGQWNYYTGVTFGNDQYIVATLGGTPNYQSMILRVRGTGTPGFDLHGYVWDLWAGTLNYFFANGAAVFELASGVGIPADGATCKFQIVGQVLSAYEFVSGNWSLLGSFDDSPASQAELAAGGSPGLGVSSPGDASWWDDAELGNVDVDTGDVSWMPQNQVAQGSTFVAMPGKQLPSD